MDVVPGRPFHIIVANLADRRTQLLNHMPRAAGTVAYYSMVRIPS